MPRISQHFEQNTCVNITQLYAVSTPPPHQGTSSSISVVCIKRRNGVSLPARRSHPLVHVRLSFASKSAIPQPAWSLSLLSKPIVTGAQPLCSRAMPCPCLKFGRFVMSSRRGLSCRHVRMCRSYSTYVSIVVVRSPCTSPFVSSVSPAEPSSQPARALFHHKSHGFPCPAADHSSGWDNGARRRARPKDLHPS